MTTVRVHTKIAQGLYGTIPWPLRRRLNDARYHRLHKRDAMAALHQVEAQCGKLSASVRKEMEIHAVERYGSVVYLPWLLVFSAVQKRPAYNFMPDNFYGLIVKPKVNQYGWISQYKSISTCVLGADVVATIGYSDRGRIRNAGGALLDTDEAIRQFFQNHARLIFKPESSSQGRGIHVLTAGTFREFASGRVPGGVFQPYYEQHPFFDSLCKATAATIRLTTVRGDDGAVSVRAGLLMLARAGESHVQAASSLKIPIDLPTSSLCELGYLPSWLATPHHPDSDVRFGGLEIPHLAKCVELVLAGHRRFPFTQCIGWDVTVDKDDQPRCFEWNGGHNGIRLNEATQGPLFADLGWEKLR